jgi:hypothetical protein
MIHIFRPKIHRDICHGVVKTIFIRGLSRWRRRWKNWHHYFVGKKKQSLDFSRPCQSEHPCSVLTV